MACFELDDNRWQNVSTAFTIGSQQPMPVTPNNAHVLLGLAEQVTIQCPACKFGYHVSSSVIPAGVNVTQPGETSLMPK